MNGCDTELDEIASCNLQSSLYSLSHFNKLKVMSHLAICASARLRKTDGGSYIITGGK